VLHRIRDVDIVAIDACFVEAIIEQEACGTDEWLAFDVFAVAGLFADQHEPGAWIARAEDGLRRVLVERTTAASSCCLAQGRQITMGGEKFCR
jgi:hypothetical protein